VAGSVAARVTQTGDKIVQTVQVGAFFCGTFMRTS
jgi:hypothetical protein